ncbi:hypothetical protein F5B21DRAFT_387934 [Xylaria acuta]|nr:hypothetical protein F5B21DRAFT_387934 [Xylaria acuta]
MQEIIRRHPESLEEVDQFGHTPLHLAINRPSCLRLILNTSGPSLLEKQDIFLQIPLDYACLSGCKESVRLFLTSGSRITYWCLEAVHDSCQNDLLLALKHRRDELKRLALDNLTRTEAESLGLYENAVLDANAIEVQRLLYSRGVNIPPRLYVERMWHASVYHWSISNDNSVSSFDQLWALGFRDIDCLNSNGRTPMMEDNSLDAVRWLIEHGANYWTPLNERSDSTKITEPVTPTHSILGKMGDALGHEKEYLEFLKAHQWLIEKLLRVRVGDACSCPCSVGGCTPWKAFLDGMVRYQSYAPTLYYPAALCVAVIEAFQTCLGQDDLSLLVRRMTFDALELTHTCCRFANYISEYTAARHTSEEIDEINSEQRALLTLFADLMDEFEQVAFEDQCGTPLIASDPEGFWVRRWLPRIRETLDTLDGDDLTPEEKSAAEAIGVVWGPQPVHRTECEDEDDELDWGSPEWVMREMEKIMNK